MAGVIKKDFATDYRLQVVWNIESQNEANNTSTVSAKVQLVSLSNTHTIVSSATKNGYLKLNGNQYNFTFSAALSGNQTKTLFTKTLVINHNADGTKNIEIEANCNIGVTLSGVAYSTVNVKDTVTLDTIARATQPTLTVSRVNIGETITINLPRASNSFTHTVKYTFNDLHEVIKTNVTTSLNWTLPTKMANTIPNTTEGICTITCNTYKNTTLVGTKTVKFTAVVPSSYVPIINSISVVDTIESIKNKFNAFIQGKSKLKAEVNAVGIYGSTIKSTSVSLNNETINESGNIEITATATDSRGRTVTKKQTINILPYIAPVVSKFAVFRADNNGVEDSEGTNLKAVITANITPLGNKNDKSYKLEYKETAGTEWVTLKTWDSYSINEEYVNKSNLFHVDKTFQVRLSVSDFFGTSYYVVDVSTAFTLLDFHESGQGLAVGKVAEQKGLFDIAMLSFFRNGLTHNIQEFQGDINNIDVAGEFFINSSTTNKPAEFEGWLVNMPFSKNSCYQRIITINGNTYERLKNNGIWEDWCGTFEKDGWAYEKKLDGTARAWTVLSLASVNFSSLVADSWYRVSESYKVTYPLTFKNKPLIFTSSTSGTANSILSYAAGQGTTACGLWLQKMKEGIINIELAIEVLGTWK